MSSSQSGSLKARLKRALQARPVLWSIYWRSKQEILRFGMLRYFLYDMRHTYRAMHWPTGHKARQTLSSALLFKYHKLEKGLVMPGKRRFFGVDPADATMKMLMRWQAAGYERDDPVYAGAVETLRGYRDRLSECVLDPEDRIFSRVDRFLADCDEANAALSTPQKLPGLHAEHDSAAAAFRDLVEARRSVREYRPDPVPYRVLAEAVRMAQLSPSACNRQPWRVFSGERRREKTVTTFLSERQSGFRAPRPTHRNCYC